MGARKVYAQGGAIRLPNGVVLPPGTVPVIDCSGWSEAQRKAYVLADNQLALNAGWDVELLRVELADLEADGFNMDLLGFGDELDALLASDGTDGLTDPDEVPEPPADPVTRAGDVWLLGRHRITCGDSTNATDVERVLMGVRPLLMVTDPPYGVNYDSTWRDETGLTRSKQKATGLVVNDDRADWREAWALFPGDVAYVWHNALHAAEVADGLTSAGFAVRAQIVWAKQGFVFGRGDYHWQHEPCWYVVRKSAKGHWAGDRKQSTLWQIDNANKMKGGKVDDATTGHGTQKPVECMKRPIENNSAPGQAVYEPFSGSGTTIIAAEMTGRQCFAIELSPAYVDVAVTRWEKFAGQAATLDGDGRTFAEVLAERLPAGAIEARVE
jgi:DNA modification methylase